MNFSTPFFRRRPSLRRILDLDLEAQTADVPSPTVAAPFSPKTSPRFSFALCGLLLILLGGCLLDLEGGPVRLQVKNTWSDTLLGVSVGNWHHAFDPTLAPGGHSETIELPASGTLTLVLRGTHGGRDSVLASRTIDAHPGEFVRLE